MVPVSLVVSVTMVTVHSVLLLDRRDVLQGHCLGGGFPKMTASREAVIVIVAGHEDVRRLGVCCHGIRQGGRLGGVVLVGLGG